MVDILSEFKPLCTFIGSDVRIECRVKGITKRHVVSWIKDGTEITRGEDILASDDTITKRISLQLSDRGDYVLFILRIRKPTKRDEGTYSLRVYDQENIQTNVQKDVVSLCIGDSKVHTYDRMSFIINDEIYRHNRMKRYFSGPRDLEAAAAAAEQTKYDTDSSDSEM